MYKIPNNCRCVDQKPNNGKIFPYYYGESKISITTGYYKSNREMKSINPTQALKKM